MTNMLVDASLLRSGEVAQTSESSIGPTRKPPVIPIETRGSTGECNEPFRLFDST